MENDISHTIPMDNVHFAYSIELNKFLYLEDILVEIFGSYAPPKVIASYVHPDDLPVAERAFTELMQGTFKGSVKFRLGHGESERWLNITPFFDRNVETIYGCAIDISAEIDNLNSITKYTNKKNSVLHMLAHDLRGPLDIARSLVVQMANSTVDENSKRKSETIATILKQSIDLITNLTDREFLEMVESALIKRRIDLVQKLGDYLEECRRSADLADRNFILESTEPTAMAEVDEAKFMQVINNLMSNALKFTAPGGLITVKVMRRTKEVFVVFSDNGIGIPESLLPKIFDKFTTAARPGLNGERTIGLGLSIVKDIIDWHQGKIWCESEEGKGSSFFISLPNLDQGPGDHTE